jgi:hypothetical protein
MENMEPPSPPKTVLAYATGLPPNSDKNSTREKAMLSLVFLIA